MNQEFVPYELAVKLKQLGFDEPCFVLYKASNSNQLAYAPHGITTNSQLSQGDLNNIAAPLFQQAFRWFRENYSLYSLIGMHPNTKEWYSSYQNLNWSGKETLDFIKTEDRSIRFKTYEEAELAALDKLIKILESKQQEQ